MIDTVFLSAVIVSIVIYLTRESGPDTTDRHPPARLNIFTKEVSVLGRQRYSAHSRASSGVSARVRGRWTAETGEPRRYGPYWYYGVLSGLDATRGKNRPVCRMYRG